MIDRVKITHRGKQRLCIHNTLPSKRHGHDGHSKIHVIGIIGDKKTCNKIIKQSIVKVLGIKCVEINVFRLLSKRDTFTCKTYK